MTHEPLLSRELLKQTVHGHDLANMTEEERKTYFHVNLAALVVELGEASKEISWKPWASGVFFNRKAYLGELADAQLFLDNLVLLAIETDVLELEVEFHQLIREKIANAIARQKNGYDGVTDKCPDCKRDETAASWMMGSLLCPCGHVWEIGDLDG